MSQSSRREVYRFAFALKKVNKQVRFVRVPIGEHYQSMVQQGIPKTTDWLKHLSEIMP